jgi:hypothetical protein
MRALQRYQSVLAVPPVPFRGAQFVAVQTTTTNETTTTFTGYNIGTPHPFRVVCVCAYVAVDAAITVRINGTLAHAVRQNELQMAWLCVPQGTTADVEVSSVGSLRKSVAVYILYPTGHMPLSKVTQTQGATTDITFTNLHVSGGGCVIYCISQAVLGTFTATWGGIDAVVEDSDAQLEASSSVMFGHINITQSSNTNTLTLAESTSGNKRGARVIWGL